MRAAIKITYVNDTQVTALAIVPDFIAWERKTKRRTSDLAQGISVEDLAYLAYAALKRQGEVANEYDTWVQDVAELEMDDRPGPKATPKAASKGS